MSTSGKKTRRAVHIRTIKDLEAVDGESRIGERLGEGSLPSFDVASDVHLRLRIVFSS